MIKILIIDDHSALRESLAESLKAKCGEFFFLHAQNGSEAKDVLSKNDDCITVLLDIKLGGENGLLLLPELRKIRPSLRVLVYSAFAEMVQIEAAIKANVQGFVPKTADISEIVDALKAVSSGNQAFSREAQNVMQMLLSGSSGGKENLENEEQKTFELFRRYKTLTKKEQEIFLLIAKRLETSEIATRLKKSVKTVENQRTSIYTKLGIHDRLGCVEAANRLGIDV